MNLPTFADFEVFLIMLPFVVGIVLFANWMGWIKPTKGK